MRWTILVLFLLLVAFLSWGAISLTEKQVPRNILGGGELHSPSDWLKEQPIQVYKNRVVLQVEDASWARFTDTNSMDPFIDAEANAIEILPDDADLINVGDVISYTSAYGVIIHRVVEKGVDEEGIYFIVKGDNNASEDPLKVRFEDIKGVVVAVVY